MSERLLFTPSINHYHAAFDTNSGATTQQTVFRELSVLLIVYNPILKPLFNRCIHPETTTLTTA